MATTVKQAPPFNPLNISGLTLWIDSVDSSTVTTSGSSIVSVRDKSSPTRTFLASPTPPTRSTTAYNGLFPFQFNGSSFLFNSTFSYTLSTRTAFLVCGERTGGNNNGFLSFAASGTDYNQTNAIAYESGFKGLGQYLQIIASGLTATAIGAINTPTPFAIYGDTFGSGTENVYSNGSLIVNTSTGVVYTNSTGLYLGARMVAGSVGNYLNGIIAEVLLFNRVLTTSERQQVEGYLAWKWGLLSSLPSSHPFRGALAPFTHPVIPFRAKKERFTYFDPRTIPTCGLWLDAADSSTLTFASGSQVSIWRDKTARIPAEFLTTAMAQARNASSTGATNYPLSGYSINGQNALYFNKAILQAITTQNVSTRSYFFVIQCPPGSSGNDVILWPGTWVSGFARGASFSLGGTSLLFWANQNIAFLPVNLSLNALNPTIVSGTFNAGSTTMFNNGNATTNPTGQTSTSFGLSGSTDNYLWIGGESGLFSTSGFYLGEFLVYNSALSTSDRQQIEGYLAWKWGVNKNLPSNHPQVSVPSNPFQLTAPVKARALRVTQTYTQTFTYTGALQTFTVPSNVSTMSVYLWGAGGGGAYITGGAGFTSGSGGAGAMVQGVLAVTPGSTLYIVVGKAGVFSDVNNQPDALGGGGMGYYDGSLTGYTGIGTTGWGAGSGGGRSAIQFSSGGADQVVAGGGGGGGVVNSGAANGGSGTFSGTANPGTTSGGGTQSSGGTAGNSNAGAGSSKLGGAGWTKITGFGGGGGGGGYYGGGGGGNPGGYGSGAGGSSYTGNLTAFSGQPLGYNSANGISAPNTTSPYYVSGVATGGSNSYSAGTPGSSFSGGNGLVVLVYTS